MHKNSIIKATMVMNKNSIIITNYNTLQHYYNKSYNATMTTTLHKLHTCSALKQTLTQCYGLQCEFF